ncbi:MAG: HD-GYP domain-containing protein [Brevinematia bacterium]
MSSFDKEEVITVSYLKEGMVLNGPLYDLNGSFLWPAKVPLKKDFIESLINLGIKELSYRPISFDNTFSKENVENPMISQETQKRMINGFSNIVWDITNGTNPKVDKAKESVEELAKEIKLGTGKTINLIDLKGHDSYSYVHAVNSSILATFIATKLGFSIDKVYAVGLGALLMDIGKIKIPNSILQKQAPLSQIEIEMIRKHPIIGYQLVKDNNEVDEISKRIILMHHEQYDGKGYPLGVDNSKIDIFSKIASLCDSFDAMITERPYRPPLPIRVALEEILKDIGKKYEPEITIKFSIEISKMYKITSPLSVGTVVLLNTNEVGVITKLHNEYDILPEVSIVIKQDGTMFKNPLSVDLMKDPTGRKIYKIIFDPYITLKVKSIVKI